MDMDESYPKALTAKRFDIALGKEKREKKERKRKVDEISEIVKVKSETVRRWIQPQKGIPEEKLSDVANYFNVPESIFKDESLSDEDFKKIISDPASIDNYRHLDDDNKSSPEPLDETHDSLPTPEITVQGKASTKVGISEWIKMLILIVLSILLFYYFEKANPIITPIILMPG